jgi:hypothetical protein
MSLEFPAVTVCNNNKVHCGNLRDLIEKCGSQVTGGIAVLPDSLDHFPSSQVQYTVILTTVNRAVV